LSEMRRLIGNLVDPESRNNEVETEDMTNPMSGADNKLTTTKTNKKTSKNDGKWKAEKALAYLRLVSPKCDDYLLRCQLDGQKRPCNTLFKLVLTDSGDFTYTIM